MKRNRKILSVLLCLMLLVSCLSLTAFAAEQEVALSVSGGNVSGEYEGTAWSIRTEADNSQTLVLEAGCLFRIYGQYTQSVENNGTVALGTFQGLFTNNGTITGGTYSGPVTNYGTITNGTFEGISNHGVVKYGTVTTQLTNFQDGVVEGGSFSGSIQNYGVISGGTISGSIQNHGVISGGTILGKLEPEGHICFRAFDTTYELGSTGHIPVEKCRACSVNSVRNGTEAPHSTGAEGDKAATCTAQAYCSVCKRSYGELSAHSWKDGVCEVCTASCGHDWDNGVCKICTLVCAHSEKKYKSLDDVNHQLVCAECSVSIGEPIGHTGGTATCIEPKTCEDCKTAYGERDPANHASTETRYRTINENGHAQHVKTYSCCTFVLETLPHRFGDDNICDDCNLKANVLLTQGETVYGYSSFSNALAAAQELEGSVVKLCGYSEGSSKSYEIKKGTFTIDLNGCSISSNDYYINTFVIDGGDVTITDTSASQSGKIRPGNHTIQLNGGTLRIHGGTIKESTMADYYRTYAVDVEKGNLYVDGGSVESVRAQGINSRIWVAGDAKEGVINTSIGLLYHSNGEGYPVIRIAEALSGDDTYTVYRQYSTSKSHLGVVAQGDSYTITAEDAARFKAYISGYTVAHNTEDNTLELKKALTAQLSATETTYDSIERRPVLSVKSAFDDSVLTESTDYTVSYLRDGKATEDFTSAGIVTIEVNGVGDYAGSHTLTYTIKPMELLVSGAEFEEKIYDGTKNLKIRELTVTGYQGSDSISVGFDNATAAVESANVGEYDLVTISGLTLQGDHSGNYVLTQPVNLAQKVTIGKAEALALSGAVTVKNNLAKTYTVDLAQYAPTAPMEWGSETYSLQLTAKDDAYAAITAKIENGKMLLTVPYIESDAEKTVAEAVITVTGNNFKDSVIKLNLVSEALLSDATKNTEAAEKITAETVKLNDRDVLEAAKKDLEQALAANGNSYIPEEKQAVEAELERIDAVLEIIDHAEAVNELIEALPANPSPDSEAAMKAYDAAKAAYENLTDYEKTLVDTRKLEQTAKALVNYKVIKGDGAKWYKTSGKDLSFTANGAYRKFVSVEINGETLSNTYYTVKSGSTVITLDDVYLNKLSVGKYTITVNYTDGSTDGVFYVRPASEIPQTGDSNDVYLWGGALALSCIGLAAVAIIIRRKNKA